MERKIWRSSEIVWVWSEKCGGRAKLYGYGAENMRVERNCMDLERKIWELSEIVWIWSGKYEGRAKLYGFGAENMGVERNCVDMERKMWWSSEKCRCGVDSRKYGANNMKIEW